MNRIGLVQLSNSARNSPYNVEKATFDKSSINGSANKSIPEPLKLKRFHHQPSPLSTSITSNKITPVSSPFDVFCEADGESKENVQTQTFEYHSTFTQTTIHVPHIQPTITAEDLTADSPTVNYLRVTADRLQLDFDDEMELNERLVQELCDLDERIGKIDDDTEVLMEVLADIDEEQDGEQDDEIGTAHV
ncbi:unnamed protein product [Caenorhabditis brenneri]